MKIYAQVAKKQQLSNEIYHFSLQPEVDLEHPTEPGSHIDIFLKDGQARQYSIFDTDQGQIHVAIQRETNGRGGSLEICNEVQQGDRIEISTPRNNFKLQEDNGHVILLGAGIGITPVISMALELNANQRSFELHYFVRNKESSAFEEYLLKQDFPNYHIHFDDGDENQKLNLKEYFHQQKPASKIYMCGPEGFMSAVESATSYWEKGSVVKERFSAVSDENDGEALPFTVRIKSTDQVIVVEADEALTDALRKNGVMPRTSCSEGVCGSCIVDVVSGTPIHKDGCLSDEERDSGDLIVPCVSRANPDEELVLDL